MMEFYSGREVKIVISSAYFPFEFWTTFFQSMKYMEH